MRRQYSIRQKLKHLQRNIFEAEYRKYTSVHPYNCRHNILIDLGPGRATHVCDLGPGYFFRDKTRAIICEKVNHASMCTAYNPIYRTKEDVANKLYGETLTERERIQKWPELAALEWVLGDDIHAVRKHPNFLARFFIYIADMAEKLAIKFSKGSISSEEDYERTADEISESNTKD